MSGSVSITLRPQPTLPRSFDFVHALALLSTAVLSAFAAHLVEAEGNPPEIQEAVPAAVTDLPTPTPPPPPRPTSVSGLDPKMRNALDYTSRRYRLSPQALEPIFFAAALAASEAGIDPLLVIAVIGVESGFNPLSGSAMGAQGLMQVIPRYHADKLLREKQASEVALTLFDPVVNVRVGTKVLLEYIRANGGVAEGLQQYVGAVDDPDQGYAAKVLAERERLEMAARRRRIDNG